MADEQLKEYLELKNSLIDAENDFKKNPTTENMYKIFNVVDMIEICKKDEYPEIIPNPYILNTPNGFLKG